MRFFKILLFAFGTPALAEMRPIQEWPLGACAESPVSSRICLDGPKIWSRYGHGAPEIEVAVIETFETFAMGQILSQHPFLQHLDIPQYWHARVDDPDAQPRPRILEQPDALRDRTPQVVSFCRRQQDRQLQVPTYCEELDEGAQTFALAYLDWRSAGQHELKMIGLIAGQSAGTLRRTGLTPLGTVSLHYVETNPAGLRDLESLSTRLDRRPGTRVVNYSNEGPYEEMLDLQYARIYRTALAVNAGRTGVTGRSPTDRLLVASSANTTGVFSQASVFPAPDPLLPPEAQLSPPVGGLGRNHRPVVAFMLGRPQVPVLVVGGITSEGELAERTRIEPMIDIYAPSGNSWRTLERSRARSAELMLRSVRDLQNCRPGPSAIAEETVVTLDWAETRDIRRSVFLDRIEEAWRAAGPGAILGPVGCLDPQSVDDVLILDRITGNSVATALVSAVAAQMFALDPQLSAADAREILLQTARANRVNGLPVLDAPTALSVVLTRFVERSLDEWAPGAVLVPDSLASRSIAPGLLGQEAWRNLRDDPPLEIALSIRRAGPGGSCVQTPLSVLSRVEVTTDGIRRTARTYLPDNDNQPCEWSDP